MLRRSPRLESMGHYNSDGKPIISYRETLYRIWRSSHHIRRRQTTIIITESDNISDGKSISNSRVQRSLKKFGYLFLMLSLCLGFADLILTLASNSLDAGLSESPVSPSFMNADSIVGYKEMAKQLRELQNEQWGLKRRMNILLSPADSLPNFALESQGASVVFRLSSTTYVAEQAGLTFFGIPIRRPPVGPKTVIQGHSHLVPGNCWAFAGGQGHLYIALSHPITISHVTLGHISKSLSPTGSISSSPKEFSVYGMETLDDEGTQLGTFLYDKDGDQLQTFKLPDNKKGVYNFVKLQVQNNWGHPDYSCLYSFRVHGKLAD